MNEEPALWRLALDVWRAQRDGPEGIARRRDRRLAGLVAHARAHSPFYRRLYAAFNAAYFLGANVSALLAGVVIAAFDLQTLLVVLVCFGVLFSICVFVLVPKVPRVLQDRNV